MSVVREYVQRVAQGESALGSGWRIIGWLALVTAISFVTSPVFLIVVPLGVVVDALFQRFQPPQDPPD